MTKYSNQFTHEVVGGAGGQAALGAGVGGEALVDALATLAPSLDWAPVAATARQAEQDGTLDGWIQAGAVDPLARLSAAGAKEIAAARCTAQLLADTGALYLMHGLGNRSVSSSSGPHAARMLPPALPNIDFPISFRRGPALER
ncbi:hypothetical protein [Streptomyces yerevanensis]|uniref:hypothetical protein n=1 Tax=Streptomyces yerevanensis TaxID=66378 RepID=UPI0005249FA9|nr:hypothetical protein [Streptomyces yerevanensis]